MKTKIQIKSIYGSVLFEFSKKDNTIKDTLVEAVSKGAGLRGADLQGAYLRGAGLRGADLRGADLWGADLQGAYLRGAGLRGADLRGADLRGAYLRGADLRGADLRGAKNLSKIYQSDLVILNYQKNKLRAFKFLNPNMTSPINDKKIEYKVGKTYKEKVDKDKLNECGEGLNVATLEWCLRESGQDLTKKYIEVEFNPEDLIVPYFSDGKFRVSKLKVIRVLSEEELKAALENI